MAQCGKIPGLKRRPNGDGTTIWYWVAAQVCRDTQKFKPRTASLWQGTGEPSEEELAKIRSRAEELYMQLIDWRANPKRMRRRPGLVYFVRGPVGVKMGFTTNLSARLEKLQTGSAIRLTLIGTVPGTPAYETLLKRRFAGLQLLGEWFREAGALVQFIQKTFPVQTSERPSERLSERKG